jgi:hypothetical protein
MIFKGILYVLVAGLLISVGGCNKNNGSSVRESAFGKKAIQEAIAAGKLQNVYYDGKVLKARDGFMFERANIMFPNGTSAKGFRLKKDDGGFVGIDVACSCDGMSSSGACGQIGSDPLGVICGGSCQGCEAFVLF